MTLLELADRVEKLKGPDREVDAEVFRAIGAPLPTEFAGKYIALTFDEARHAFFMDVGSDMVVRYEPPRYTVSIDSAMSLVPDGFDWIIARTNGGLTIHAEVGNREQIFGDTPALALTAAALRARAAQ